MYSCHFSSKKIALSFFTCSLMVLIKVHITPKMFLLKWIQLLFERAVKWKKFWIWLSPRFSIPFQSRVRVLHDPVSGSLGRRLLMTSTQKPNTMAPQSALCICPRKWKTKLIVPMYFGVRGEFQFWRLRNKLRSSTYELWTHCLELWEQFTIFQATKGKSSL